MINQETAKKIKPGATVRIYETVKEISKDSAKKSQTKTGQAKSRTSVFEGLVLARKHGNEAGATFTVRAIIAGVGVEKIYPIHSPTIAKVDVLTSPKKVRRAKLYYFRDISKKQIRQKIDAAS